MYYRGLPIYHEPELPMSHEMEVGQVLDGRFQITEVISRSGMASIFKAKDLQDRRDRGGQGALHAVRERPGLLLPLPARGGDRPSARTIPTSCTSCRSRRKSRPYIVMEYLKGQTLRQVLRSVERLPVADALDIAGRDLRGPGVPARRRTSSTAT